MAISSAMSFLRLVRVEARMRHRDDGQLTAIAPGRHAYDENRVIDGARLAFMSRLIERAVAPVRLHVWRYRRALLRHRRRHRPLRHRQRRTAHRSGLLLHLALLLVTVDVVLGVRVALGRVGVAVLILILILRRLFRQRWCLDAGLLEQRDGIAVSRRNLAERHPRLQRAMRQRGGQGQFRGRAGAGQPSRHLEVLAQDLLQHGIGRDHAERNCWRYRQFSADLDDYLGCVNGVRGFCSNACKRGDQRGKKDRIDDGGAPDRSQAVVSQAVVSQAVLEFRRQSSHRHSPRRFVIRAASAGALPARARPAI